MKNFKEFKELWQKQTASTKPIKKLKHLVFIKLILLINVLKRFVPLVYLQLFLFGPRGTGKSTWLRQYFPEAR